MFKLCPKREKEVTREEKSVQADGTIWKKKRAFIKVKESQCRAWGPMRLAWEAKPELSGLSTPY